MDSVTKYQRQLLDQARQIYHYTPISEATAQAYLGTPRHLFVRRYRERASKEWCEVNEANLHQHLGTLYADKPLTLFGDDDDNVPSTISQPSFVLRMLDLLQLQPGQTVFELGTGSGWNAALIGHLVGPSGRVYSLEIIPEVAQRAADTIAALGITNVRVVAADGGDGNAAGAPYDRITFTAGTYDLPGQFHEQIKADGLLLVVIKNEGGGDNLFVLQKMDGYFESIFSMPCGFVQMTGRYKSDHLDPTTLEALPEWTALQHREIARRPFWWGGKGREFFVWQTPPNVVEDWGKGLTPDIYANAMKGGEVFFIAVGQIDNEPAVLVLQHIGSTMRGMAGRFMSEAWRRDMGSAPLSGGWLRHTRLPKGPLAGRGESRARPASSPS